MLYSYGMRVRVLFFGMLKEWTGRASDVVDLPAEGRVADLLTHLRASVGRFSEYETSLAVAVNREYASTETVLRDGDEVAILPPVSGGSETASSPFGAEIIPDPIDTRSIVNALTHRDVGAVVVFEGVVRDNTRGRRTLYLDYEAYEPMALTELESLLAEARQRFAIGGARVVHRVGRLQIGETSVLIAVAAPHRAAGFEACRWLIDTLKKTVPIWKKEYFEDGAVWADGDPFPEELRAPGGPGE